ncbi:DUF2905 domain-containing protein [Desulfonauticus submarinus]
MFGWGSEIGKFLILLGFLLIGIGVIFLLGDKLGFRFGGLPGDIVYKKGNFTFYFPWVTCLIVSMVLTLILSIFRR